MALVDASRVSELHALDRTYHPEAVVFQLPTLGKKRFMGGASLKQIVFGAFLEDSHFLWPSA